MVTKGKLIGCLAVVLLLGVLAMGAAYWFVLRPMWNAGAGFVDGARDWASAMDLGEGIGNDAAFAAPADGRLTQAQVDAFVRVQSSVAAAMGDDLAALAERARAVQGAPTDLGSLQDIATAYGEVSALFSRFKQAQATAVNAEGLSRQEYSWVRRQALAALPLLVEVGPLPQLPSLPEIPGVPELPKLPELPELPGQPGSASEPEALAAARYNAELLRPHLDLLQKTLTLGLAQP